MRQFSALCVALLLCACVDEQTFDIELTHGGGFTGQVTGVRLGHDGVVQAFRQLPGTAEQVVEEGRLMQQQARALATGLQESIGDWTHSESGNMTSTLTLTVGDSVRTWSWPTRDLPQSAPQALHTWLDEFGSRIAETTR